MNPTRQSKRQASRRGEVRAATITELAMERDAMWQMSIHGGLAPYVRENARKKYYALQKKIERLLPSNP